MRRPSAFLRPSSPSTRRIKGPRAPPQVSLKGFQVPSSPASHLQVIWDPFGVSSVILTRAGSFHLLWICPDQALLECWMRASCHHWWKWWFSLGCQEIWKHPGVKCYAAATCEGPLPLTPVWAFATSCHLWHCHPSLILKWKRKLLQLLWRWYSSCNKLIGYLELCSIISFVSIFVWLDACFPPRNLSNVLVLPGVKAPSQRVHEATIWSSETSEGHKISMRS